MKSYVISASLGTGCYRHIRIGEQETLDRLHGVILNAFDFDDDHAHAFFMDDRYWSDFCAYYSDDMDEGCRMSYKMPLGRLGLEKGDKFKYLFDFGDEWRFQCRVMQELEEKTKYFRVIKAVGDPRPSTRTGMTRSHSQELRDSLTFIMQIYSGYSPKLLLSYNLPQ